MRGPHSFRRTLTLSSAEIVFSTRILMTLLRYCAPLPSGIDLFVVLILDLDLYGGNNDDGMFLTFFTSK